MSSGSCALSARVSVAASWAKVDADARDLAERVHAGIGPPGAVHGDRRALEPRERVLEQPLDRLALGLPLPADEPRAVVREGQLQRAHRGGPKCDPPVRLASAREPGLTTGDPAAHSGHASG